jgi:hydroxymethylpyrimidine/phosphomethylpyrimidine kinase
VYKGTQSIPVVMVFAANDPTGGAGMQADIETMASLGCHAAPVITAITVQDTLSVKKNVPTPAPLLIEQARAVLEDMPVAAFKIGPIGSVDNASAIHTLLTDYPELPVVIDPVLTAAGGALSNAQIAAALKSLLLPLCTIATPNSLEARALVPTATDLTECIHALMEKGCKNLLVTGGHEPTPQVTNHFYGNHALIQSFNFDRLRADYHGSGCTLASAIAALLAQGHDLLTAVSRAQEYTYQTLKNGFRLGMGQRIPNRWFWVDRIYHQRTN